MPASFSKLTALQIIGLSENELTSSLPGPALQPMTHLRTLEIADTRLAGALPDNGLRHTTSLQYLSMWVAQWVEMLLLSDGTDFKNIHFLSVWLHST
eukprot:4072467-Amphidinium_carterae.1